MHNAGYKSALARRACRYSDAQPPRKTDGIPPESEIPPHMRGKGPHTILTYMYFRITPAYAGKSWQGCYHQGHHEDHPRVCGEKADGDTLNLRFVGSPPRMRGKVTFVFLACKPMRITPAYAGKRHRSLLSCATTPDHSRICGEKDDDRHFGRTDEGSPPHMRGKVLCAALSVNLFRITPAYAGKSLRLLGFPRSSQDHPRICGEKLMNISTPTALQGSPPRMRGKAGIAAGTCRAVRITPAYAGKSLHGKGRGGAAGDHPRICGEKKIERMVLMMAMGSPPHMRGKGYTRRAYRECPRITPAYAGKRDRSSCMR